MTLERLQESDLINGIFSRTRFYVCETGLTPEIFRSNRKQYFVKFPDMNSLAVVNTFKNLSFPMIGVWKVCRTPIPSCSAAKWVVRLTTCPCSQSFSGFLHEFASERLDLPHHNVYRLLLLPVGATTPESLC